MTERETEFAKRVFGVETVAQVNTRDDAEWRRFLNAIDYAIESHPQNNE